MSVMPSAAVGKANAEVWGDAETILKREWSIRKYIQELEKVKKGREIRK